LRSTSLPWVDAGMSARSPWLVRVLVPSWRFFEAEDARYLLEARCHRDGEAPSAFAPAIPSAARTRWSWLFAPEHNLRLFCHDLVERFVLELAERSPLPESEIGELASFARVRDVAAWFLRERRAGEHAEQGVQRFQLRLLAVRADDSSEELFVSPYYTLDG
jgi:hypothetical protein